MKTLVDEISGRKDLPIFDGTNEQIKNWAEANLDEFDLNEEWSCSVSLHGNDLFISGDEDSKHFRIISVSVIKL